MVKQSLGPNGSSETRWMRMGLLSRTKKGWLLRGSDKRKELTMRKPLHLLQDLKPSGSFLHMLPTWVSCALVKCPMLPLNNLGPDESGVSVNETLFRDMIGSLMYLTTSRPDMQFSTCLCARYQANPKESYLVAVKRIFRCNLDRKSTSGGFQILDGKLVCWSAKKQSSVAMSSAEVIYLAAGGCCA
ncbi:hypothetical protein Tco_0364012 [Tanacetum coccineum]